MFEESQEGCSPRSFWSDSKSFVPHLREADSELLVHVASKLEPDGGVRGIDVGDDWWREPSRSSLPRELATAHFQCGCSTKAGCDCDAHIVEAFTNQDANAKVVTIDGLGAFDLISKSSLLEGLVRMEDGDQILPFARCLQGEGGEQGDPFMPMLLSLGDCNHDHR